MKAVKCFLVLFSVEVYAGTYRLIDYVTPVRSGTEIHYYLDSGELFTVEEYYGDVRDGYAPDPRFLVTVTNTQTVSIPEPIQSVANAYQTTLESIYGDGAATNTTLTREAVAIDLSLRDDVSAEVGLRLSTWFDILNAYWGRGEIWSFPYGQSTYTVTNTTTNWKAEDDE